MVIRKIEAGDVVALSRRTLALPEANDVHDAAFLAALIRRAAAIVCPCSAPTLERVVMESLDRLSDDTERLADDVEAAVERATIAGDLLELNQVATDDPNTKGTWLFAAPPAFVSRPSGSIFLLGVTPDEPSPLPPSLNGRIAYERHYRLIHPHPSENLTQTLLELGLLELSERSWLKFPRDEAAKEFKNRIERELHAQGPSGDVPELIIVDSARDPSYYKGRWVAPKRETGSYVARRPQAYGAPLWGLALLVEGALQKFLDFPFRRDKWRGSDFAWHLQMAIDSCRGSPQKYRRRRTAEGTCLDFFSPVPLWAERRLAIIGRPTERERCLFSYQIPDAELAAEEKFLQTHLWIVLNESSQEGS
jgi:hypothetical protein